mgnify:FL=1
MNNEMQYAEKIRKEYAAKTAEENKLETLHKLDAAAPRRSSPIRSAPSARSCSASGCALRWRSSAT